MTDDAERGPAAGVTEVAILQGRLAASEKREAVLREIIDSHDPLAARLAAETALTEARTENARLRMGKDRWKAGVRAAVTWMHVRAQGMVEPRAQGLLNTAATNLGWDLAAGRVPQGAAALPGVVAADPDLSEGDVDGT